MNDTGIMTALRAFRFYNDLYAIFLLIPLFMEEYFVGELFILQSSWRIENYGINVPSGNKY